VLVIKTGVYFSC